MYQAVFFDFDGVVLDSYEIKTKAFEDIFAEYGKEIVDQVLEYHHANGGVSRVDKFRYYYKNLLKKELSDQVLQSLINQYVDLTYDKVLEAPFIDGALETLKELTKKNVPTYVVSGIPQDEIVQVVQERNLDDYFDEVHGSPRKKTVIIEDILQRKGYSPGQCLFLGDALTDYYAAKACGLKFLGIVKQGQTSIFPKGTEISSNVHL